MLVWKNVCIGYASLERERRFCILNSFVICITNDHGLDIIALLVPNNVYIGCVFIA